MRVLIRPYADGRREHVLLGAANALLKAGHSVSWWPPGMPDFDALDTSRPDLLISDGPLSIRALMAHPWMSCVDANSIAPAFDSVRFPKVGSYDPALACDVAYVGDYKPEWRATLDRIVFPLIERGLKVKLFGKTAWPVPQYLGDISDAKLADLARSASCMVIPEGDIDAYHAAAGLGGVTVGFFDGDYSFVEDLHVLERHLICSMGDGNRGYVLGDHTYFHRLADIFREMTLHSEADRMLEAAK